MAGTSKIEWTDATWNPIVGCSVVSAGCTNCYAQRMAGTRLKHTRRYKGLTDESKAGPVWNGQVKLIGKTLTQPLHWRKPRRIFVNSMGDLFHESVPDEWIDRVFAVMALAPQHTFMILTKRAERMRGYLSAPGVAAQVGSQAAFLTDREPKTWDRIEGAMLTILPNVWLGVSVEDQARAEERIPYLLETPAAVRFVSAEPLLGQINLHWLAMAGTNGLDALKGEYEDDYGKRHATGKLDWVICGGESGPGARPMHPGWARSLRDQCVEAGVPFFFKQWGNWGRDDDIDPSGDALYHLEYDDPRLGEPRWQSAAVGIDGRYGPLADKQKQPSEVMYRCGKKDAGRLLDGREWNEMPEAG